MFLRGHLLLSEEKKTEPADMAFQADASEIEQKGSKRQPRHDDAGRQQLPQEQPLQQYF
jgi:hypothetical protein